MNILQEGRVRQGFTQMKIAEMLDLKLHTVYQYESGRRHPKITEILKVAKVYGLSDEEIILYLKQVAR